MTLQQVIKTGKPFRRPVWGSLWMQLTKHDTFIINSNGQISITPSLELYLNDLIADDYETIKNNLLEPKLVVVNTD